jgi:hypothetical protein
MIEENSVLRVSSLPSATRDQLVELMDSSFHASTQHNAENLGLSIFNDTFFFFVTMLIKEPAKVLRKNYGLEHFCAGDLFFETEQSRSFFKAEPGGTSVSDQDGSSQKVSTS